MPLDKEQCKRCIERASWAHPFVYENGADVKKPVWWDEEDEDIWNRGYCYCPHSDDYPLSMLSIKKGRPRECRFGERRLGMLTIEKKEEL